MGFESGGKRYLHIGWMSVCHWSYTAGCFKMHGKRSESIAGNRRQCGLCLCVCVCATNILENTLYLDRSFLLVLSCFCQFSFKWTYVPKEDVWVFNCKVNLLTVYLFSQRHSPQTGLGEFHLPERFWTWTDRDIGDSLDEEQIWYRKHKANISGVLILK